jgi:N-hydroxyarylamine O-acetyltransferase
VTDDRTLRPTLDPGWTQRYLTMLGLEHPEPNLDALTRLTRAHVERMLFGSLTSLFRRHEHPVGPVPPLDPAALLDAWQSGTGTGVCFEAAEMVSRLLDSLGYRVQITLATVGHGWAGGHQGVVVHLDGRQYLVDVGNGAPYFEPIPLDGPVEVWHVGLGYRFRPGDDADHWIQERCIDGTWTHFCTYDLQPATPEAQEAGYQRHHTPGESWVVGSILVVRCAPDAVTVLRDNALTRYTADGKENRTIVDAFEYRRIAADQFNAPNLPIDEARAALAAIQGAAATAT